MNENETITSLRVWNSVPGCKLSEFERVTALKVYNWFANRRKEMKRRANIGENFEFNTLFHCNTKTLLASH